MAVRLSDADGEGTSALGIQGMAIDELSSEPVIDHHRIGILESTTGSGSEKAQVETVFYSDSRGERPRSGFSAAPVSEIHSTAFR